MTEEQKQQLDDKMGQAFYNDVLKLEQDLADEQKRNAILREELLLMAIRVKDAETSRDTIRAHAQAGLNKYRAQDAVLKELRAVIPDVRKGAGMGDFDGEREGAEEREIVRQFEDLLK